MNPFTRFTNYLRNRKKLKYRFHKFLQKHSKAGKDSPLVMIWEMGGFAHILRKNAIISAALNFRGYRTHFIVCDGTPVACIQRGIEQEEKTEDWEKRCKNCLKGMRISAGEYAADYSLAGSYIDETVRENFRKLTADMPLNEIYHYNFLGVDVGMLAWSSLIRHMKGHLIEKKDVNSEHESLLRKYLYAGLVNTYVAGKAIDMYKPEVLFGSHGVYVDYAPPVLLAYLRGIKAIIWSSGFKDFLHYFTVPKKPNRMEFRGMTDIEWKKRLDTPLTGEENRILDRYIHHRFNKGNKRDFLNVTLPETPDKLRAKFGFDNGKPVACLFCHVSWDLSFDLSKMIFDNANQWLTESMNAIFGIENVNWLIRVHPGEKASGSLYTNDDFIRQNFNEIPGHVRILWSDSEINSLGLYKLIDVGITLFGTMGAELPVLGKPVISGGEAHFTGKGFTIDAKDKDEYFRLLKNIAAIPKLTDETIEIARKYAYSYFIQRQIPITVINRSEGHFGNIDPKKFDRLLPGKDPVIGAICSGIINGKDVILDEEMVRMVEIED